MGHLLFGDFSLELTTSLLLGAIPGAFIGAQISSRAPGGVIRRALAVLLLASGLRLLGLSTELVLLVAIAALVGGSLLWIGIRRTVRGMRPGAAKAVRSDTAAAAAAVAEGQRGAVVFLTGLSGAGKSTIAEALAADLRAADRPVTILDGDELRKHLSADLGFDSASRERNVQRAAELAARFAGEGQIVISALIAPFDRSRLLARETVTPVAPFLLVWVRTPLAVAEARDPKGLYKRARAGEIPDFTGIDSPYEDPSDADLVIDTTQTPVPDAVSMIRRALDAHLGGGGGVAGS